jgi:hypothetical protein
MNVLYSFYRNGSKFTAFATLGTFKSMALKCKTKRNAKRLALQRLYKKIEDEEQKALINAGNARYMLNRMRRYNFPKV